MLPLKYGTFSLIHMEHVRRLPDVGLPDVAFARNFRSVGLPGADLCDARLTKKPGDVCHVHLLALFTLNEMVRSQSLRGRAG
jgi:hypothetical protein